MRHARHSIGLITLVLLAACSDTAERPQDPPGPAITGPVYHVYTNDHFGYSLRYRADLFTRTSDPQTETGLRFDGPGRQELAVYGTDNPLGRPFADQVDEERARFAFLAEDRDTEAGWTGFGYTRDGDWQMIELMRTGEGNLVIARFTAPPDASFETRELARATLASLRETGTGS